MVSTVTPSVSLTFKNAIPSQAHSYQYSSLYISDILEHSFSSTRFYVPFYLAQEQFWFNEVIIKMGVRSIGWERGRERKRKRERERERMDERCFRPLLCTVKAELGWGQPGLMR